MAGPLRLRSTIAVAAVVVIVAAGLSVFFLTRGAEEAPALPKLGSASGAAKAGVLAVPLGRFGFDLLLKEAAASEDNVVISPASLHAALSMLLNGAREETAAELRRTLQVDDIDQAVLNQAWADLITAAQASKKTKLQIADSLWLRNGVEFKQDFLGLNRDYFAAELGDLADGPAAAAREINAWIEKRTHGKIPKLFDSIDPLTLLTLVNTVYLKVSWEHFDPELTAPAPFTLTSGERIEADTMHAHLDAAVSLQQAFDAVLLPTDGPVDVWVIVPKGTETPESVASTLRDQGTAGLYAQAVESKGDVALPKLSLEYEAKQLRPALQALGMRRAWSPDDAQLEGIADVKPLFVQGIRHKATLDMNEEGVEAAAATGIEVGTTGMPVDTFSINADRPFLVVLAESTSRVPLFMSLVRDPR